MGIVAAFLWNKSPPCFISTMIFDEDSINILNEPTIYYFSPRYLFFRKQVKKTIRDFFNNLYKLYQEQHKPITLEFKILFETTDILYLIPAKESQYVRKVFLYFSKKTKMKIKLLIKPQLRNKLSGKALKKFKYELRNLDLVSRRRDTGFEYHLWTVALHATEATYAKKLGQIKNRLVENLWLNAA